jgi:hypothetical protein
MKEYQERESLMKSMLRTVEFDVKFKDDVWREALISFCQKIHTEEGVLFLQKVQKYRKAPFNARTKLQHNIYETFIKSGAPKQINLAHELVEEIELRLQKGQATVDMFQNVENNVKNTIMFDILPRFEQQYNFTDDSTSESSTTEVEMKSTKKSRSSVAFIQL